MALDSRARHLALAQQLQAQQQQQAQFEATQGLQRERMAQDARFRQADDDRMAAQRAPQPAYVDQYLQGNPQQMQTQVPNVFSLLGNRGALGTGEQVFRERVDPQWQSQMQNFATASADVQRDILGNIARQRQAEAMGQYRNESLDNRREWQQGVQGRFERRQGETERRNQTTEEMAAQRLQMSQAEREAKAEGYRAMARLLSKQDPESAAEFAMMAEGMVNPLPAAQFGLASEREARIAKGPPPNASAQRVADMLPEQLLAVAADPNAKLEFRIDAERELIRRMPEADEEDLLATASNSTPTLVSAAEAELAKRGFAVKRPWHGVGSPTLKKIEPKSAKEEPLVPGRAAPAPGGKRLEDMTDEELMQALQSLPK
jgi:hypothetical protein